MSTGRESRGSGEEGVVWHRHHIHLCAVHPNITDRVIRDHTNMTTRRHRADGLASSKRQIQWSMFICILSLRVLKDDPKNPKPHHHWYTRLVPPKARTQHHKRRVVNSSIHKASNSDILSYIHNTIFCLFSSFFSSYYLLIGFDCLTLHCIP